MPSVICFVIDPFVQQIYAGLGGGVCYLPSNWLRAQIEHAAAGTFAIHSCFVLCICCSIFRWVCKKPKVGLSVLTFL